MRQATRETESVGKEERHIKKEGHQNGESKEKKTKGGVTFIQKAFTGSAASFLPQKQFILLPPAIFARHVVFLTS
jgi:hypothetical protein